MTYIYKQLTTSDITRNLSNDEYASWHKDYQACKAIAEYLEQLAEDTGEAIELDTVAIRCEYSMIESIEDFNEQYEKQCRTLDDVRDYTTVIEIPDSEAFIIGDF
jgi:hypothetical protein